MANTMTHDPLPSLERLQSRIETLREATQDPNQRQPQSSGAAGMRMGVEFCSGVLVGAGFGYLLDQWLNTTPLFLILFMGIGTAAGVRLMTLTAGQMARGMEEEEARAAKAKARKQEKPQPAPEAEKELQE